LATFSAPGTIGLSHFELTDQPPDSFATGPADGSRDITATSVPESKSSLSVRVGSCLQWHGYRGQTLYVLQNGGRAINQVTLSGVKD
jgi:hypothetical protein